jgi:tight adherence protein B
MILMVLAVFIAVFALAAGVIVTITASHSKLIQRRLHSLQWETAAIHFEGTADIRRAQPDGRIAWLHHWLVKVNLASRVRLFLYQAGVSTPVEGLLLFSLAGWAGGGAAIYLRTGNMWSAILISAALVPLPGLYVLRKRAKRFARFEQQLPEALDLLVGALRVGHSLITGIGALGLDATEPLAGEFRKLFDEQNFGLDPHTAMTNLALRVPLPDVQIFVAAALIQKESGGNLAEVLAKVAQTTRSRFQLKKQVLVHTAQGRMTGWVLSAMPILLGLGMYLANPEGMSVLWTRPLGVRLIVAAGLMIATGWVIIQKIVRIRV